MNKDKDNNCVLFNSNEGFNINNKIIKVKVDIKKLCKLVTKYEI